MAFFRVCFIGRPLGAIGVFEPLAITVEAPEDGPVWPVVSRTHEVNARFEVREDRACPDGPSCPDPECIARRKVWGLA